MIKKIKKYKKENLINAFIFPNLYKPLSFHLSNLSNNGIILSEYQIKYLLQKVREFKYTNDEDYLKDISNLW